MGFTGCSPICGQTAGFQGGALAKLSGLRGEAPVQRLLAAATGPPQLLLSGNGKRTTKKILYRPKVSPLVADDHKLVAKRTLEVCTQRANGKLRTVQAELGTRR